MGQYDYLIPQTPGSAPAAAPPSPATPSPSASSGGGQYDYLIPKPATTTPAAAPAGGGMFDNLIPNIEQGAESLGKGIVNDAEAVPKALFDFGQGVAQIPGNVIKQTGEAYAGAPAQFGSDLENAANQFNKDNVVEPDGQVTFGTEARRTADLGIGGGRLAGDFAGVVFAPLSAAIGSALKAAGGQTLMDKTGQVIADSSGITNLPAFQQFALEHPNANQDFQRLMNIGLSTDVDPGQMASDAKEFANKIVNGATPTDAEAAQAKSIFEPNTAEPTPQKSTNTNDMLPARGVPIRDAEAVNLPVKRSVPVQDLSGGEQVTPEKILPEDQLPTIQMGKAAPSDLPTIQIGEKAGNKVGGYTYEPVPEAVANASKSTSEPVSRATGESVPVPDNTPGIAPKAPSTALPPEVGNVTKAASDINAMLVSKGIDALPPDELAKLTPIQKADQIARVGNLLDTNPTAARQMALGRFPIPDDIHPQVLFNAVKNAAFKAGDVDTMRQLANSPHATARGEAAQTMSAAGFNNNPDDPVAQLQRIKAIKEQAAGADVVAKAKSAVQSTARANLLPKEEASWNNFIEKITC